MKNEISNLIKKWFKNEHDIDIENIEITTINNKFGDFSSNFLLKEAKKNNLDLNVAFESFKKFINESNDDFFEKVELVKGFVNFTLSNKSIIKILKELKIILSKDKLNIKDGNIEIEFVSANPTGLLHIGHARNAIIGDVIANNLSYLGNNVFREYYINDAGNQINSLGDSVEFYLNKQKNIANNFSEEEIPYKGEEIITLAKELFDEGKNFSNKEDLCLYSKDYFLDKIKKTLDKLKIKEFDNYISERELFIDKKVENVLNELRKTKFVFEDEGALWINTQEFGDDKNRVLIKSDDSLTYMVADVANHVEKYKNNFDRIINVWGKDHHGYEKRIKASMEILGYDSKKLEVEYISMVKVFKDGEELKMSKRAGTSLTIDYVLGIISPDLLKYSIVSKSKEQNLSINIDDLMKSSMDNQFWYVQYAYARISNLIKKYNNDFGEIKEIKNYEQILENKDELKLLLHMNNMPDVLIHSAYKNEPNIIWNYLYELASYFHYYYNFSIIISDNNKLSLERINFLLLVKKTMERVLNIIGISPIEKI